MSHSLSPGVSVPVFMFIGPLGALWQVSKCWVLSIFFLSCGVSDSRYQGLPRTPVVIGELWVGAGIVLYNLPHGQGLFWKCSGVHGQEWVHLQLLPDISLKQYLHNPRVTGFDSTFSPTYPDAGRATTVYLWPSVLCPLPPPRDIFTVILFDAKFYYIFL